MTIEQTIKLTISKAIHELYQHAVEAHTIAIEPTRSDVEGDYTFVVFPFLKQSKKGPEQTAQDIGEYLKNNLKGYKNHQVIKGFLNITLDDIVWIDFLLNAASNPQFGMAQPNGKKVLVEYSSPNTNKPLHLGHVRNNLLGYAVAELLKAAGNEVHTCNLVNDRGIHICKSMYAWMTYGNGETPESSGMKGDHLVGKYYVIFDQHYKQEIKELVAQGKTTEEAEKTAPSILAAQELLRKWEAGDSETVSVWKMMNQWVYDGFDVSYKKLGVSFDKFYYESNTYLLGKDIIQQGLSSGVFFKKDDGSVWIDLTNEGLDQKLLLRGDGTSVYITQDIGTAELKYSDFKCSQSIYVVGNEQDYHFKVLQLICKILNRPYADGIYHLSYGMVELPHGKMKSREGTVVDADDLMDEMIATAEATTKELGKTEGMPADELAQLYTTIGMGALKYFILKVDPKKKMLFNPEESIDFHGNTGPFIQYTHARIKSILRNANPADQSEKVANEMNAVERKLIKLTHQYPVVIQDAANQLSPGVMANYTYEVAKVFNQFYHECSILKESDTQKRALRLQLASLCAYIIHRSFGILGIAVPERM